MFFVVYFCINAQGGTLVNLIIRPVRNHLVHILFRYLMKKSFIILVIVAISISLLGLLGIQLYWIRNAVAIKEVNFDRGVSEAVSRAIYRFNKQELARKMTMQHDRNQHLSQLSSILDSLNRIHYNEILSEHSNQSRQEDEPDMFWQNFGLQRYPGSGYIPETGDPLQQDPFSNFFERSRMINDLFDELFYSRYSFQVTDETTIRSIDSLLRFELDNQGIKTPYEFGVYNPHRHLLVTEKTGKHSDQLMTSPYQFHLFPNDLFVNPEYLLVYFPQQERYIFSQMNAMLGTSFVLLLILISSFAFTIFTIIRQKKLSVMKNDFINNMTHELKTPISTISLACQALSDQDVKKSEPLYKSYIQVINEENERLGLLTERVLQTALIEKARIRLNITGLDLHETIQEAADKVRLQIEARHGQIDQFPEAEYSFIKGDKVHLTNVFSNLIDNANKYSTNAPEITISTENTAQGVIVHVADKGIGINRANQKKIFDNLYRVSTGNIHDVKGFGLGLSYVKAIVEQHGGTVSLESEQNKGSRFTVFIPFGYNGNDAGNN